MNYAADDHEAIRRRMEELAAERALALTGSTLPEEPKVGEVTIGWPFSAADYDPA